jgi:Choline/ethanolamine kinase
MALDSIIISALAKQLGVDAQEIIVQALKTEVLVSDATHKFLVYTTKNKQPQAFVLVSPTQKSNAIKSGYMKLCGLANKVGSKLAQNLLMPLEIGESNGLSYSISEYHRPLHTTFILKKIDNWRVRASLVNWIIDVARVTKTNASIAEIQTQFTQPLRALSQANGVKQAYKNIILETMEAINTGIWQPCFVSAHNDLWRGNVLSSNNTKFVLIDWDGVTLKGYAFYDLVRVAGSFNLSSAKFQVALQQYCGVMQCSKLQAKYYLISAFAFLYADLGDWQYERFLILLNDSMEYFEMNA